jgi:hypothetical protein
MIERYATVTAWAEWFKKHEGVRISNVTIRNRLRGILAKFKGGKDNQGRIFPQFSEVDVRRSCEDLLVAGRIQVDADGLVGIDGVRHGSVFSLSRLIGVSCPTIFSRLPASGLAPIKGRDTMGKHIDLYSEPAVRDLCGDLLNLDLIQVGDDGFVEVGNILHGTIPALARLYSMTPKIIRRKTLSSSLVPVQGKAKGGQLIEIWPEPAVRALCRVLLSPDLVQVGDGGFGVVDDIPYAPIKTMAKKMGLSKETISEVVNKAGIGFIRGRLKQGNICKLYPVEKVKELCAGRTSLPQADKNNFFVKDGMRLGTINALAKRIGLSYPTIVRVIEQNSIGPTKGREKTGHMIDFYPEGTVRNLCAKYFGLIPLLASGFVEIEKIKYGTIPAFAKKFCLSETTIIKHMKANPVLSIKARLSSGHLIDIFPEPSIRQICADLIQPLSEVDSDGFLVKQGLCYGTVEALSGRLAVSRNTIRRKIDQSVHSICVKDKIGRVGTCYSEIDIRRQCEEFLQPAPLCDKAGFVMVDGVCYGSARAFSRKLKISQATIAKYLGIAEKTPLKGRRADGPIVDLYPEPAVLELCRDLIERNAKKNNPESK